MPSVKLLLSWTAAHHSPSHFSSASLPQICYNSADRVGFPYSITREDVMGVYVSYRRVPAALLDQFLATRDEDAVFAWASEDEWKPFPHTIRQFDLYSYGTLHQLLNPQKTRAAMLWNVIEGATPLLVSERHDPDIMYVRHIRYLRPPEVTRLAEELANMHTSDFVDRFAALWRLDTQDKRRILTHPDFVAIMRDYERLLCFFQIAAEMQDGIIRWYSG